MIINYGNYKIDIKAKFNINGKETYTKRETEAVLYELINALREVGYSMYETREAAAKAGAEK